MKWFHSDRQIFDEVRIKTVPRYKQSYLSGDEWRISAYVEFLYKGEVIWEQSFRNCKTAVQLMYGWFVKDVENNNYSKGNEIRNNLCDQEGCKEKATIKCIIKQRRCVGGGNCGSNIDDLKGLNGKIDKMFLQFCDRHSTRGDGDLQDNDDNYIKEPLILTQDKKEK